jgi:hypothetical protein
MSGASASAKAFDQVYRPRRIALRAGENNIRFVIRPHELRGNQFRIARNRRHSSGTPLSLCIPRSSKSKPEPATKSRTVCETNSSPGAARAATRAPMCTAIPARSSPTTSHSPVCRPQRTSRLRELTRSRIAPAQRIARAGPGLGVRDEDLHFAEFDAPPFRRSPRYGAGIAPLRRASP